MSSDHLPGDSNGDLRAAQVAEEAASLLQRAESECPAIEGRLKFLADRHGGEMIGLEFKIKPRASLERKMLKMWLPGQTIADVSEQQYDVLRFTVLLPPSHYTVGVEQVLEQLKKEEGCTSVLEKNYWNCHTYRGLNTIYRTKNGCKFEVQFHTHESFEQKQYKTHLLYEALRKAEDPVTQNVYFLDMMSLWDAVTIPPNVESLGSIAKQELPQPKHVSDEQQAAINRVWGIRQQLRNHISDLRAHINTVSDSLRAFVTYMCQVNKVIPRRMDCRLKGALNIRRKVEEEARRMCNLDSDIESVDLPEYVNGRPINQVLKDLAYAQSDLIRFKIVAEEDIYFTTVTNCLDLIVANGFVVHNVDNYWADTEKHNAVTVCVLIPEGHAHYPGVPLRFQVQFHTSDTFRLSEERKLVMEGVEAACYRDGQTFNKISVDMCTRYDHRLMRQWAKVRTPERAACIGKQRLTTLEDVESKHERTWLTPKQQKQRAWSFVRGVGLLLSGFALGVAASKFGDQIIHKPDALRIKHVS